MNIKFVICFFSFLFIIGNVRGQVTIGSGNPPAKGALLDMKENESATGGMTSTKGIIFPRVNLSSLTSLEPLLSSADATDATQKTTHRGVIVYNIAVSASANLTEGLYCWDGTRWLKVQGDANAAWLTQGNTGTDTTKNFIGTIDTIPLIFKVNSKRAGYLSNTDGFKNYTSFGFKALSSGNTGEANNAFGYQALKDNTTGAGNSAFGMNALAGNINGSNNTAMGNRALANSTGQGNTAVGSTAMSAENMTGSGNVAVGQDAMHFITSGNDNTAIGTRALINNITAGGNVAVGNNALQANVLGSNNTAVGTHSLGLLGDSSVPAGENNTAIGKGAGSRLTRGNNNIFLGVDVQVPDTLGNNQMNIGNVIFGNNMTGTVATPAGNIGIGTNASTARLHVDANNGPVRFQNLQRIATVPNQQRLLIDSVTGNIYRSPVLNNSWLTTGNIGTTPTTNYIGTSDSIALSIRTNSKERIRVTANGGRVGIGTSAPDASAILDLTTTNKGFLPPRIALKGINDATSIPTPATGLLVYNPTQQGGMTANAYYYNTGTSVTPVWTMLQPLNTTQGSQVKRILYTGSTPDESKFVELGRFRFRIGNASGVPAPQFSLSAPPASSISIAFHQGEYYQNNGYQYTSDQSKTFTTANYATYQIITSTSSTTERNELWVAYPGDANIWQVQFVVLGTSAPYTYAIVATMY